MPDYNEILDTQTDPDAPLTSQLGKQFANNWIAGFEGATGAPRLFYGALQRLEDGSTVKIRDDAEVTGPENTDVVTLKSFGFAQQGDVSFTYQYRRSGSSSANITVRLIRVRGDSRSTLQSDNTLSTSYSTRTVSTSVVPGDLFLIEGIGETDRSAQVRNARILTSSDSFPWPVYNFGHHENIGTIK
jgi:hypothetical protein